MTIPEEYLWFGIYGDRGVFERRLDQGYTEVAYGTGEWVKGMHSETKVNAVMVFYHPKDKIATYEFTRHRSPDESWTDEPYEDNYEPEEFGDYLLENRIYLHPKQSLADIVDSWKE